MEAVRVFFLYIFTQIIKTIFYIDFNKIKLYT